MKYLLDTMVISGLRQNPINKNLERWYLALPEDGFFLSAIAIGEIQKGICLLEKKSKKEPASLKQWLARIIIGYEDRILPITTEIASEWGNISCMVGNSGIDNLIAATAKVHNLVVATRNIRHFQATGVACVNPWEV